MLRSKNYTRTVAGTEPATKEELRRQLRIDHTEDDADLEAMLAEARLQCETLLGDVSLIDAVCIDYFDEFDDEMELHWSPVDSITSVVYTDTNGDSQTLSTATYELGTVQGLGVLRLKYNQTWPSARSHADVIAVTYKAGFGAAASDVPASIKRWIKARAAWLYNNRDGEEYPWQFNGILEPYRVSRIFG